MQSDMHYYATYAMAVLGGIPPDDAQTVAHASQWVDDQNDGKIETYSDGASIQTTPTAHHPVDAGVRAILGGHRDDARHVWVPFHFIPGGVGDTYADKMLCRKDSEPARDMLAHHLSVPMARNGFGLHLAGIAAHAYADTFSHYGFSGYHSPSNAIEDGSLVFDNLHQSVEKRLRDHYENFRRIVTNSADLGHGGVGTNPDQPYLRWSFRYADGRSSGPRDNPATFLEACHAMHGFFARFSEVRYGAGAYPSKPFPDRAIAAILAEHLPRGQRETLWKDAMRDGVLGSVPVCADYRAAVWQPPARAEDIRKSDFYLFHCAADYHRSYVLRVLLPSDRYGLVVA